MLRVMEICNLYKITKPTLYKWIKHGLPSYVVGNIRFFDKEEVDEFIKRGGVSNAN